jgi:hypothetical protein
MARLLPLFLLAAICLQAGKKPVPPVSTRGENQDIVVNATLYVDPDSIKGLLGNDLEGHYIVVAVKIEPKYGKEVAIDRDDFVLKTDKDGERTKPFAPTQIAGRGALVVRQVAGGGGGVMGESGIGMGPLGYPGSGGGFGNGGSGDTSAAEAKMDNGSGQKENPLVKVLADKILPDKKTEEPVSGLLYFPMEKQKVKDLELLYGVRDTRITMRFK